MSTAEVIEKRSLTPTVRHLALEVRADPAFRFTPGQFIQFIIDPKTLRQFSLASSPELLPRLELCVDISPMGKGSRFVEALRLGDRVTFRGPFGVFTVPDRESRPVELIATGAGIAPIRAMIDDLLARRNPGPAGVTLTFGNRTPAEILYDNEWRERARMDSRFTYTPTLSQPPADWTGLRGRVTEVLPARRAELAGRPVYICGSPEMVDDVRRTLASIGVPEADVHFEKFY